MLIIIFYPKFKRFYEYHVAKSQLKKTSTYVTLSVIHALKFDKDSMVGKKFTIARQYHESFQIYVNFSVQFIAVLANIQNQLNKISLRLEHNVFNENELYEIYSFISDKLSDIDNVLQIVVNRIIMTDKENEVYGKEYEPLDECEVIKYFDIINELTSRAYQQTLTYNKITTCLTRYHTDISVINESVNKQIHSFISTIFLVEGVKYDKYINVQK